MNPLETGTPETAGPLLVIRRGGAAKQVALWSYLTPARADEAAQAANRWIKALRHALVDGVPFRDRFTYRGDSLWWFAEIYLHKTQAISTALTAISAVDVLVEQEGPGELVWLKGDRTARLVVAQAAAARGIGFVDRGAGRWTAWRAAAEEALRARSYVLTSRIGRVHQARPPGRLRDSIDVAFFVHAAFLRSGTGDDVYVGPIVDELAARVPTGLRLIAIGPRTGFRGRGWTQRARELRERLPRVETLAPIEAYAPGSAIRPSLEIWRMRRAVRRALAASPDLRQRSVVRGCSIWPVVAHALSGVAELQFPWSAQVMDEVGAALDALEPKVVVTYAEAGGWGRALGLEARRRGIPYVGLQHGFIYRDWLNYGHEPDEMQPSPAHPSDIGFPRPTLTLLHDELAARHLRDSGHFPPGALAVTGSTRLDSIVRSAARLTPEDIAGVRSRVGATRNQHLVILAAKFSQIGAAYASLVEQLRTMPDVQLVVKCHPAETPELYERVTRGAVNVRVAPPTADLGELIAAARLLITVNSTAAIEALVLAVPALVVNLPTNLSPFVDEGVMAGASGSGEIGPAIRSLLYDENRRAELAKRRQAFLTTNRIASDGHAAERAAEAILSLAKGPSASCAH